MQDVFSFRDFDKSAFNRVYEQYHRQVYSYIFAKTGSEYYAEEVVQLTFIKLWEFRKKIKNDVSEDVLIFRIAKTSLVDMLRTTERKNRADSAVYDNGSINLVADTHRNLENNETVFRIKKVISSLPPVRKKVFEMSRFDDMSHKEISKELNIAPKTVENHINLALKYIKSVFFTAGMFIATIIEL